MKHLADNNFNSNKLENVPTPIEAGDATNKEYVDTSISSVSKSSIGLGNVDNTSDLAKPISTATQNALNGKANSSHTHPVTDLTATGRTNSNFLRGDNTWQAPPNTTYSEISEAEINAGTASTLRTITGRRADYIIEAAKQAALEATYPVGSAYWNGSDSRNPSVILGFGTWAAREGVVLGGRSTILGSPFTVPAGTIIGADTHTLTEAEMPSHNHSLLGGQAANTSTGGSGSRSSIGTSTNTTWTTESTGDGQPHNNIQRTRVGYLWERTA